MVHPPVRQVDDWNFVTIVESNARHPSFAPRHLVAGVEVGAAGVGSGPARNGPQHRVGRLRCRSPSHVSQSCSERYCGLPSRTHPTPPTTPSEVGLSGEGSKDEGLPRNESRVGGRV